MKKKFLTLRRVFHPCATEKPVNRLAVRPDTPWQIHPHGGKGGNWFAAQRRTYPFAVSILRPVL
ncbi:hypothetical protein LJC60_08060 [Ruminococcaceae bacterium OttesenSCG-928-D13]|nr:hypothetical protein [Ruminococcaceae bacterium OttesenSCG-928-D13]